MQWRSHDSMVAVGFNPRYSSQRRDQFSTTSHLRVLDDAPPGGPARAVRWPPGTVG